MRAEAFLDSNVLLYALSDAPAEAAKQSRAAELIRTLDFGTSYQVLMETWVTATRKFARPVPAKRVAAFLERLTVFPCVAGTPALFHQAFLLSQRYQVHPYDAAILAAAAELGATTVYSEDLNHGQSYGGVKVINPFKQLA
jgi:predicted nucleic acid-binding protein